MIRRNILLCFSVTVSIFLLPVPAFAAYVLPYPSYMPGNTLYRVTRIVDRLKKPLYFGNLSSFTYHLGLSDKYVVEAKTLFEYKQYLLAVDALSRSDREFSQIPQFLVSARKEGKDISTFELKYAEAAEEHVRVLSNLVTILPESFEWAPENAQSTTLSLKEAMMTSIALRKTSVLKAK